VAAINSLLEVSAPGEREANAAEILAEHGAGRTVALVGHFPFIEQLRPQVGELWVIEQQPAEGEFPAQAAAELLPKADVIAITGSAFVNHTLDGLLALSQGKRTVMVLGPSTPLSPVLFEHGATILSGARVVNEASLLRTVGQGAGFRQVEGVRLLTLFRGKASQRA
jgi:hypothetical protein